MKNLLAKFMMGAVIAAVGLALYACHHVYFN